MLSCPVVAAVEGSVSQHELIDQSELFFEQHRNELKDLFRVLGMEDKWSDNLDELVDITKPWVQGDHFKPTLRTVLSGDAELEARSLYQAMGLIDERSLPTGHYDQVIVLGGTQRANNLRLSFLAESLQRSDINLRGSIVVWGGQRDIFPELEVALMRDSLKKTEEDVHPARNNAWLRALKERGAEPRDETELLRLAALHRLGDLSLRRLRIRLNTADPLISHYEFVTPDYELTLLHTPAVHRPQGEPRHTTEACAKEWLKHAPPSYQARVAFISGNPYMERTSRVVEQTIQAAGRTDISIIPVGPAAYPDAKDYLFLGEIARNLYEDSKMAR